LSPPDTEAKRSKEQPVANQPAPSDEFLKHINNPRRQLIRFYARLVIVLALLTAVLAVLAGYFGDTALLVVVLVVGGGLVFAYTCGALMARSAAGGVDRQLEDFRHDKHLAVWHCSADEWRQFADTSATMHCARVRGRWPSQGPISQATARPISPALPSGGRGFFMPSAGTTPFTCRRRSDSALPLPFAEFVERFVNLRVQTAQVRAVHVTVHEEAEQVTDELGTKVMLGNVGLE
jgi:hypothetical protein